MRRLSWGVPVTIDLDALRLAARLALAGGRDALVPFDINYVAGQLGMSRTAAARRMTLLHSLNAVRFSADGRGARITDTGLALLAGMTNELAPLLVPACQLPDIHAA